MTRGRVAGVFAAAVVAAVLGALLLGRGAGSPVAAAATKSAAAGGAKVSFSLTLHGPKLGGKIVRVTGSGVVDGPSADITIADTGAPAAVPTSFHALLVQQAGHELAFVQATPMPAFTGGKSWVEVDLSQLASSHGVDLGKLGAGGAGETPTQILDLLRGAGAAVTDLGPAAVAGASTTHYRVLVDAAELARVAGIPFVPAGQPATQTVPVDVWIGKDGLVHRVALALGHGTGGATFSATIGDYGTNVSVSAPPSSDVLNATGFLTGAGGIRPFG